MRELVDIRLRVLVPTAVCALLQACQCGTPTAPAAPPGAATTAPMVVAPETTVPSATPVAAPERAANHGQVLDAAQRADVIRLVREGRSAARAERWGDALGAFDRALAIEPRAPRLLCEAGYVALRGGSLAIAGRRIDLALQLFPAPAAAPAAMRGPIAMCLYNRGLVAEGRGEIDDARDAFTESLRLRPNRAVEARIAALGSAAEDEDEDDGAAETVAGLGIDRSIDPPSIAARDEAVLEPALARAFAGLNEFSPSDGWSDADVARLESRPLAWDAAGVSEIVLFSADDHSVPLGNVALVLAFRTGNGYRITATGFGGYDNTDHGVWGGGSSEIARIEPGAILRVDFGGCSSSGSQTEHSWDEHPELECYEDASYGTTCTTTTLLCAPIAGAIRCAEIPTSMRASEPTRVSYVCRDEADAEVPGPPDRIDPLDASRDYELSISIDGDRVTIAGARAPDHLERWLGTHGMAELASLAPVASDVRSDADLDAALAEYAEEMGDGDGEE